MSRTYRALLRLAPRELRERHGAAMDELFAERLSAARGPAARMGVWAHALTDLLQARVASWHTAGAPLTVQIDERTSLMAGSDIRYAWRALLRQKGATTLVVCMLALGIAGDVAVFSVVNGLFLRPFPFPHPERLVSINTRAPKWNLDIVGINYPDFAIWRRDQKLFEAITTYQEANFNVADASGATQVLGALITYEFPTVLGVEPVLGRSFTAAEDTPKGPLVVLLSTALWRERFGADPSAVGRAIRLDGIARTIVGVMPPEASFPDDIKLWIPLQGDPAQSYQSYDGDGIGRLRAGVTAEQADADLRRAHQPVWDAADKTHLVTPFARALRETYVRNFRSAARTIMAAVAVLLLIACANVAAVMLARAVARRREMGIRLALGSTRARLLRQLLIENVMLALAGGVAGFMAGRWAVAALVALIPNQLPPWAAITIDARVIAFSFATVAATVVVFGWAPALHAIGGDLRSAVTATTNGTTGAPRGRRTLWALVGGEFALAAAMLVCAMLMLKAFDRVRHVDPGFRPDHVLAFAVPLSEGTRPKPEQQTAFWRDLLPNLRALPGVDAAGLISCAPLAGCHRGNFFTVETALPRPDGKDPVVLTRYASAGYFEAMGIRLKRGRVFTQADERSASAHAVVVDETFVRTFWGQGADGLGRRLKPRDSNGDWFTVVGVVGDVKHYGLEQPTRPGLYFPLDLNPQPTLTVAIHAAQDPATLLPTIRDVLHRLDPEIPLVRVRTMDEAIRRSTALRSAQSWMLGVFATLAFVLAIGGAYGVATYLVTQRTREIGIRVALGACTEDVLRSVVAHGLGVVLGGVAAGLVASVFLAGLLGDALFGVSTHDAGVLTFVSVVLVTTALVANGVPARRAARIDPMRTLRTE